MSSVGRPFSIYIHVPFCAVRCGYCDFNTYVPGSPDQPREYVAAALVELRRAREKVGDRQVSTVYFGGGTPSLIGAEGLLRLLDGVGETFGLAPDAEVSTEANPESTSPEFFAALRRGGFTRISMGMQSAAPHVLRTLDRVHTPGRAVAAAIEAREAGFEHVSLDLIYGTPGESDADWEQSLDTALAAGPDHISAYALTIEPGTAMAAKIRRGQLPAPDDDVQARRYVIADERLAATGMGWYELSSWATGEAAWCRHNLAYWHSDDWWGIGPGAHSHLDGVRFWNVLRPAAYAARLHAGESPVAGSETLTAEERSLETVMLGLRTCEGLPLSALSDAGLRAAHAQADLGRLTLDSDRARLTRDGRLFANAVIRELSA